MTFSKADIERGYHTNYGAPEIKVKVYHFGHGRDSEGRDGAERLAAETGLPLARCESLYERAWEWQTRAFWDFEAAEIANDILGKAFEPSPPFTPRGLTCYAEGRSSGWLYVEFKPRDGQHGEVNHLPDLDTWDAIKVSAWGRFEAAIAAQIDFLSSYDEIKEMLEANDLLDPDGERNEKRRKAERVLEGTGFSVVDTRENS